MNKILEVISKEQSIGIAGHVRPDGDCFGASMALFHYLKDAFPERQVDLYLEEVPESFRFLPGSDAIRTKEEMEGQIEALPPYGAFISLDCGSPDRLGFAEPLFQKAGRTISIDHHISNQGFAKVNHIEPDASSTCEALYGLLDEERITKPIAMALYLGIAHDTGVFRHSCTSRRTMEVAGKLLEKEIPFSKMIDETFYEKTYVQNQILGRCLLESFLILDGKVIVSCIGKSILDFYGASFGDLDGIVDQLKVTKGVEAAIFIYETASQEHKVSMRSNSSLDVSKVAQLFGGGGHKKAAGCTMRGSYHDVVNNLAAHIEKELQALQG